MRDNFASLEQPRQPWLDVDALKAKFLSLSSTIHPDRMHFSSETERKSATDRYAELNAAYHCLRDTKERLAHLLELELGVKPGDVQKIPPATMDLFMQIGTTLREVDAFVTQKSQITSPLIKVQSFEKAMEWTDRLNGLQQELNKTREQLEAELKALNPQWQAAPSGDGRAKVLPLERVEEIYRAVSFIRRWSEQIQQRIVQLSLS
jgi:curved DNA-binding protein CbpA